MLLFLDGLNVTSVTFSMIKVTNEEGYDMANNISKRTTRAVIGAMHVNRRLPRILAFTGTKLLGLGL
jgi:hypothetical protein